MKLAVGNSPPASALQHAAPEATKLGQAAAPAGGQLKEDERASRSAAPCAPALLRKDQVALARSPSSNFKPGVHEVLTPGRAARDPAPSSVVLGGATGFSAKEPQLNPAEAQAFMQRYRADPRGLYCYSKITSTGPRLIPHLMYDFQASDQSAYREQVLRDISWLPRSARSYALMREIFFDKTQNEELRAIAAQGLSYDDAISVGTPRREARLTAALAQRFLFNQYLKAQAHSEEREERARRVISPIVFATAQETRRFLCVARDTGIPAEVRAQALKYLAGVDLVHERHLEAIELCEKLISGERPATGDALDLVREAGQLLRKRLAELTSGAAPQTEELIATIEASQTPSADRLAALDMLYKLDGKSFDQRIAKAYESGDLNSPWLANVAIAKAALARESPAKAAAFLSRRYEECRHSLAYNTGIALMEQNSLLEMLAGLDPRAAAALAGVSRDGNPDQEAFDLTALAKLAELKCPVSWADFKDQIEGIIKKGYLDAADEMKACELCSPASNAVLAMTLASKYLPEINVKAYAEQLFTQPSHKYDCWTEQRVQLCSQVLKDRALEHFSAVLEAQGSLAPAVISALEELKSPAAIGTLRKLSASSDEKVHMAALQALARSGDLSATETLGWYAREACALGKLGSTDVVASLLRLDGPAAAREVYSAIEGESRTLQRRTLDRELTSAPAISHFASRLVEVAFKEQQPEKRAEILEYAAALKQAIEVLHISHPFRYAPKSLCRAVQDRLKGATSSDKIVFCAVARDDHNGAFTSVDEMVAQLHERGIKAMLYEISSVGPTNDVRSLLGARNDALTDHESGARLQSCGRIVAGHGAKQIQAYGADDPAVHKRGLNSRVDSPELTIEHRREIGDFTADMQPGEALILASCSVGEGENVAGRDTNLVNAFKSARPDIEVSGAALPTAIQNLRFSPAGHIQGMHFSVKAHRR